MVLDEASRRASDRLVIGRLMVRPRLRGRRAPPWTRSRLAGGRLRNQGRWPGCGPGDGKDRAVGRPFPPILVKASAPGLEPRALTQQSVSEWFLCVSSLKERDGQSLRRRSSGCCVPFLCRGGQPSARRRGQWWSAPSAARTNDLGTVKG